MSLFIRTLCSILFCFPVVGFAQQEPAEKPQGEKTIREPIQWPEKYDPRTLKPIRLFMKREEVHEMWGDPEKSRYRVLEPGEEDSTVKEYSPEEYAADVKRYGRLLVEDIHYRKTATNRYEVRVFYMRYRREGAAEPEMRVENMVLVPATEVPVIAAIADLPEAGEVCGPICRMLGVGRQGILVKIYPREPREDQRLTPDQIARWLGYLDKEWAESDWAFLTEKLVGPHVRIPVVYLSMRPLPAHEHDGIQDVDWMQHAIVDITLRHGWPQQDIQEDRKRGTLEQRKFLALGSYIPPGDE